MLKGSFKVETIDSLHQQVDTFNPEDISLSYFDGKFSIIEMATGAEALRPLAGSSNLAISAKCRQGGRG
ncbi:hypothetical protein ACFLWY_02990 [Chloroflexota bacterium]